MSDRLDYDGGVADGVEYGKTEAINSMADDISKLQERLDVVEIIKNDLCEALKLLLPMADGYYFQRKIAANAIEQARAILARARGEG